MLKQLWQSSLVETDDLLDNTWPWWQKELGNVMFIIKTTHDIYVFDCCVVLHIPDWFHNIFWMTWHNIWHILISQGIDLFILSLWIKGIVSLVNVHYMRICSIRIQLEYAEIKLNSANINTTWAILIPSHPFLYDFSLARILRLL